MRNPTNAKSGNFLKKDWKRDFEQVKITIAAHNVRGAVAGLLGPVYHPYEWVSGKSHPIYIFEREQAAYAEMIEWINKTDLKNIFPILGDMHTELFKVRVAGTGRGKGKPHKISFVDDDGCKTFKTDGAQKHHFYTRLANEKVLSNTAIIFDEMCMRNGSREREFHDEGIPNIFESAGWDVINLNWLRKRSYKGSMHVAFYRVEK